MAVVQVVTAKVWPRRWLGGTRPMHNNTNSSAIAHAFLSAVLPLFAKLVSKFTSAAHGGHSGKSGTVALSLAGVLTVTHELGDEAEQVVIDVIVQLAVVFGPSAECL